MISPFNACKCDVAMAGNHDLDFGVVKMSTCIAQMTTEEFHPENTCLTEEDIVNVGHPIPPHPCRWLLSNIIEEGEEEFGLGGLLKYTTIDRAGKKIGFIGIGEKDWVVTFKNLECEVEY
jgi:2',3'-cyclic-nucleotide 2'-phosphodiesterase (5'-nucleotidase family)